MYKLLKFIIFSAMLVNLGSLPAMDGTGYGSHINPFFSGDTESFTTANGLWLGFGESATFDTEKSDALTADLDVSIPDGLLSQLRTSETQSPTPPDSDATSELDTTAPARKTRRRSLSATSTSSSSASAASPTDTQSTSKASELGTSRKKLQPETFVTTQPLPCLWPLETAGSESTCNETFENLENLLEHIRKRHFKESYIHHPNYLPCPYENCPAPAQQYLARLIYHFFEKHYESQLKPWECLNCKAHFGNLDALRRHAKERCTSSASAPTDKQTSGLGTPRKKLQPKTFVTTQPLPCLWPLETAGPKSTCNETFENLENLLEHIRKIHFKESYDHRYHCLSCPHEGCVTHAKPGLGRLIYHFFKKHQKPSLKPWKCLNCKTHFGNLEALRRHAKECCTPSASNTSASSSTDVAPSGEK